MKDIVIRAEGLSKRYRIGATQESYGSLREEFTRAVVGSFRYLASRRSGRRKQEMIWALKDVSFEIRRGEAVGIIGRNGAGKTMLLKILSRITKPTQGQVKIRGRVGSLLEVGTGFHPELTGRENIFLNGAILGMTRSEITRKFDEIVAFAEIEKFLDTSVKRYSSGMYVRLAFSVAAHLEPEILLVDEVLAVGDASFQKKCLGRMGSVAREGRTVLFVSHNMGAVRSLCDRAILVLNGNIINDGESHQIVQKYLSLSGSEMSTNGWIDWKDNADAPGNDEIRLLSIKLLGKSGEIQDHFDVNGTILVEIIYKTYELIRGMRFVLVVATQEGTTVFATTDHDQRPAELKPGQYRSTVTIPGGLLNRKKYTIQLYAGIPGIRVLISGQEYLSFTCIGSTNHGSYYSEENWPGVVVPRMDWSFEQL